MDEEGHATPLKYKDEERHDAYRTRNRDGYDYIGMDDDPSDGFTSYKDRVALHLYSLAELHVFLRSPYKECHSNDDSINDYQ